MANKKISEIAETNAIDKCVGDEMFLFAKDGQNGVVTANTLRNYIGMNFGTLNVNDMEGECYRCELPGYRNMQALTWTGTNLYFTRGLLYSYEAILLSDGRFFTKEELESLAEESENIGFISIVPQNETGTHGVIFYSKNERCTFLASYLRSGLNQAPSDFTIKSRYFHKGDFYETGALQDDALLGESFILGEKATILARHTIDESKQPNLKNVTLKGINNVDFAINERPNAAQSSFANKRLICQTVSSPKARNVKIDVSESDATEFSMYGDFSAVEKLDITLKDDDRLTFANANPTFPHLINLTVHGGRDVYGIIAPPYLTTLILEDVKTCDYMSFFRGGVPERLSTVKMPKLKKSIGLSLLIDGITSADVKDMPLDTFDFPELEEFTQREASIGGMIAFKLPELRTISFPKLKKVGGTFLNLDSDAPNLTEVSLPSLEEITGNFVNGIFPSRLATVKLPALKNIKTPFFTTNCPNLETLELDSLESMGQTFFPSSNFTCGVRNLKLSSLRTITVPLISNTWSNISTLELPELESISGAPFIFVNPPNLTTLRMPKLKSSGIISQVALTALTELDLPNLEETINYLLPSGCVALKTIKLPKLKKVTHSFMMSNTDGLTTVELNSAEEITTPLFPPPMPKLTTVKVPSLKTIRSYICTTANSLTALDLPELTYATSPIVDSASSLASITLPELREFTGRYLLSVSSLSYLDLPMLEKLQSEYLVKTFSSTFEVNLPKLKGGNIEVQHHGDETFEIFTVNLGSQRGCSFKITASSSRLELNVEAGFRCGLDLQTAPSMQDHVKRNLIDLMADNTGFDPLEISFIEGYFTGDEKTKLSAKGYTLNEISMSGGGAN